MRLLPIPRSRLFLRVFGWFWLALAGMLTTLLALLFLLDAQLASASWQPLIGNAVWPYADEAAKRYVTAGPAALVNYYKGLPGTAHGRAYLLDTSGAELAGQTVSSRTRALALGLTKPRQIEVRLSIRQALIGTAVLGPDGRLYSFVVEVRQRPTIVPSLGPAAIGAVLAALLVLALLCFLIARDLASPAVQVSLAARRLAGGDLKARALDTTLAQRNDEFANLARDFDDMAARIETLVAVQERLLWNISHELRSPLTRLSLALGIARRKAGSDAEPSFARIERETAQLNHLIEQLLTIARIKGGAAVPMSEPVNLAEVVQEIATDADFEARGHDRTVRSTIDPNASTATAIGSRSLLKSAIENVVRNAIRHTAVGTEVSLELGLDASSMMAIVTVRDHGPGVPATELEHLFETFYRVPENGETGGAGLGLAITEQAMRVHAGWVKATNAEGGGLKVQLAAPCTSFS